MPGHLTIQSIQHIILSLSQIHNVCKWEHIKTIAHKMRKQELNIYETQHIIKSRWMVVGFTSMLGSQLSLSLHCSLETAWRYSMVSHASLLSGSQCCTSFVQFLKTIASCNLFYVLLIYGGQTTLIALTSSWVEWKSSENYSKGNMQNS